MRKSLDWFSVCVIDLDPTIADPLPLTEELQWVRVLNYDLYAALGKPTNRCPCRGRRKLERLGSCGNGVTDPLVVPFRSEVCLALHFPLELSVVDLAPGQDHGYVTAHD